MLKQIIQLALCVFCIKTAAAGNRYPYYKYEDFESRNSLKNWKTSSASHLEISNDYYKAGERSLRWDYQPDAKLYYIPAIKGIVGTKTGFSIWIFNPAPRSKPLRMKVQALKQGKWKDFAEVPFYLNFHGWRCFNATWNPMIKNLETTKFPSIKVCFVAPPEKGWLAFDAVMWKIPLRIDAIAPDFQTPWTNPELYPRLNTHIQAYNKWMPDSKTKPAPKHKLSEEQLQAIRQLQKKLTKPNIEEIKKNRSKPLRKLKKVFAKLKLKRVGQFVMGLPLQTMYTDFPLRDGVQANIIAVWLRKLSLAWYKAKAKERQEIETMLADFLDYIDCQGWSYGSRACGGHAVPFLLNRGMDAETLKILIAPLKKIARWDRFLSMLGWYNGIERLNNVKIEKNLDAGKEKYRGYTAKVKILLPLILWGRDDNKIFTQLMNLSNYLSNGINEQIALDGATYAHNMHHPAYAYKNLNGIAKYAVLLQETPWKINEQAFFRMLNAVYTGIFASAYTNKDRNYLAGNFIGRVNIGANNYHLKIPAGYLQKLPPSELKHEKVKAIREWLAGKAPSGNVSVVNNSSILHRRGNWLISAKGMSNHVIPMEIYGWIEKNNYASLFPYGSIQFFRTSDPLKDFDKLCKGWNWNYIPGTTGKVLSPKQKRYTYGGLGNTSGLFAGVSLNGNGVCGFEMKNTAEVEGGKALFFINNFIVALGCGIKTDKDTGEKVVTTLFQVPSNAGNKQVANKLMSLDQPHVINDGSGIQYLIPEQTGSSRQTTNGKQRWTYLFSRYLKDRKHNPGKIKKRGKREKYVSTEQAAADKDIEKYYRHTEGDYARCWLDHGTSPQNITYSYGMLIDDTKSEATNYLQGLEKGNDFIEILKNTPVVQAVRQKKSGFYAAVFYKGGNTGLDFITRISAPAALIMQKADKKITGRIHDPSRYPIGKAKQTHDIELVFNGKYEVIAGAELVKIKNGNTTIRITCSHSTASDFILRTL